MFLSTPHRTPHNADRGEGMREMGQQRALVRAAKKLASKFYEDAQAIFDSEHMTDELYETEVMQALLGAQGYADEARNAS